MRRRIHAYHVSYEEGDTNTCTFTSTSNKSHQTKNGITRETLARNAGRDTDKEQLQEGLRRAAEERGEGVVCCLRDRGQGCVDETCDMSPRSLEFNSEPLAVLVLYNFTCALSSSISARHYGGSESGDGGRVGGWEVGRSGERKRGRGL